MTTTTTTAPPLEARDLTKTFHSTEPPTQVLKGIDLTVAEGEFLVVMGASGSGKSTLLYSISGMDRPTSGSVLLELRFFRRKLEIHGAPPSYISMIRETIMRMISDVPPPMAASFASRKFLSTGYSCMKP